MTNIYLCFLGLLFCLGATIYTQFKKIKKSFLIPLGAIAFTVLSNLFLYQHIIYILENNLYEDHNLFYINMFNIVLCMITLIYYISIKSEMPLATQDDSEPVKD